MKIIKHPNIDLAEKVFICEICGCEFVANKFEYQRHAIPNHCACPICQSAAVLKESEQDDYIKPATTAYIYDYLRETMCL